MNSELSVKCPKCKTSFKYYSSEFRPFCSEKCKMVDLGHWTTGSYTIASREPLTEGDMDAVLRAHESGEFEQ